ncbi:YraN family protein [Paenibacillus dakarensis]|uniref:YraN family protein n=1 Tax=Paenibacillus dakarensis TaxID=1527293 RepID=UPI0006D5363E|nr:YraN family protein [Paenibacillus dakarensis]
MKPDIRGRQPANRRQKGAAAEEAAAQHLIQNGYRILDRNWRCRTGELDIVAEKDSVLVIVEVRSRSGSSNFGTPSESVDRRKMQQVRSTAEHYLHVKKQYGRPIRFDVIAVMLNAELTTASIEHIPNAF